MNKTGAKYLASKEVFYAENKRPFYRRFFYYKESPFYALFISRFMPKINGRFEPA